MSAFKTWKILPDASGWIVQSHDGTEYESRHGDKAIAIREAKLLATETRPSQVVIHDAEGSVTAAIHYNDLDNGHGHDPSPGHASSGVA